MPVTRKSERFDYQRYLASREWALLKEQLRVRGNGHCERCLRAPYQETHHLTYARTGHEKLEDLLAVCAPCHEFLSAKTDYDPKLWHLDAIPVPLYEADRGFGQLLHCPVCQFDYSHLESSEWLANPGADGYESGWVRGICIRLNLYCENNHRFSIDVGTHKGQTFFRVAPKWSFVEDMP